jgi:acetyl coenzyme A synthetase (ADP forming)-like protein
MNRALDAVFKPKSVAVIGASAVKGKIGRETLRNMLAAEFAGKIFPVNPNADEIQSIKAYPTILDVPDAVDMAVVIVRREEVRNVARDCGEKGVKGLVVISAGFSEVGAEGKKLELEVVEVVRKYRMRMMGPNCFGVVNTNPSVHLNATFGKTYPKRGCVGFITQSGAMGEAIMNMAKEIGIGFSIIASIGNNADISANDVLEYLKDDVDTDVVLMYLENFGEPRNFAEIAGAVSRVKPIVVVKSGRTTLGAKAASSHTGALGGLDAGVDALCRQTGIMRVDTVEELFDVALALSRQPVPKGNRVCVVTNAGGPGVLVTDALISNGMEMPALSEATVSSLRKFMPKEASFSNPMDMVAGAGPKEFNRVLSAVKHDDRYDTIIPILVPPVTIDQLEVARNIHECLADTDKTVLACLMGAGDASVGIEYLKQHGLPVYIFPEAVAKTLATIDRHRRWLDRPAGKHKKYKVQKPVVQATIDRVLGDKDGAIVGDDAIQILVAYGIQAAGYTFAETPAEAVSAAGKIGYPVVMKINTPAVLHKTEMGGVIVDLRSDNDVKEAFKELTLRVGKIPRGERFSVALQKMVGGVETVLGMTVDPSFGPLLMFGLGGIYVEIMKDVSFRINPLTDVDAGEMISALRSYPLLTGFRGAKPVDLAAVEETLLRLSQLVGDFPCFSEIDINPFMASPLKENCRAVDARFIVKRNRPGN